MFVYNPSTAQFIKVASASERRVVRLTAGGDLLLFASFYRSWSSQRRFLIPQVLRFPITAALLLLFLAPLDVNDFSYRALDAGTILTFVRAEEKLAEADWDDGLRRAAVSCIWLSEGFKKPRRSLMSCGRFQGPSKLKCKSTCVQVGPLRQWHGNGEMR